MNKQPRRHFSAPDQVASLKRHLLDKVPISHLGHDLHLYPDQLYAWLKEFFENGAAAAPGEALTPSHRRVLSRVAFTSRQSTINTSCPGRLCEVSRRWLYSAAQCNSI